ncbi:uncharacterized protein LOC133136804 [Conger conger]|uniref:uncharacterized protein LOC133136804 n=1 Tax=Conger conger TaxID=82655 RepID=UPI002A59AC3D|nr:uncharacterized protein LOC133136804 [Conger conger]
MATRRKLTRRPGQRTGLRSQGQENYERGATAKPDVEWETAASSSEESEKGAKGWMHPAAPTAARSTGGPDGELLALMRDFMAGQQRREENLLAEIRGLRVAKPRTDQLPRRATQPHRDGDQVQPAPNLHIAATPSTLTASSPRLNLPTPAPPHGRQETPAEASDHHFSDLDNSPDQPRSEWRHYNEPKMPQYQRGEDIENYLLRFERIAKMWKWPESEWACRLVPLLAGKALEAYTAMDEDRAHHYTDLKAALLAKFDISPETYRLQFRSTNVPPGESPTETYHRLKGLYRRWIRPGQHTKEEVGEAIILEQLLRVLPFEVRTWVKEHEPAEGLTAAKLVLQYLNARRGGPATHFTRAARRPTPQPRPARREECPGNISTAPNQQTSGLPWTL